MADAKGLKMNPPQNRLIGSMPKIGIRPTSMGAAGHCANRSRIER